VAGYTFHGDPVLKQGRFGYTGFVISNFGVAETKNTSVDIFGLAANLRLAYKYGKNRNDYLALDGVLVLVMK
jgi:hypothetical protein